MLALTGNPTQFRKFETRYTTKGNLAFLAYNNALGAIEFSVQAGRPVQASVVNLDAVDMLKIRGLLDTAYQKLNTSR